MMQSKKKIKIDIVIFICVFVVLLIFCLSPILTKIFETTKELTSKKTILDNLEKQTIALQDFQNNSSTYEQNIQKIDKSFVSQEAPVEFIEFLEKLANSQGLKISLSSVRDISEKRGNRLTTVFQATITGDYPTVLVFLEKLEQSPWLIMTDQVSIDKVRDNSSYVILSLGFKTFSNYIGATP